MKTILSVVVGSRLHGLYNETSDYDIRGVFAHDYMDILSPFRKVKNTSWIEGDQDNTSYELKDFCKFATHGNPTILEVLWSNQVKENTPMGERLQKNRIAFLDSKRIYESHKGYAHNQYTKMSLFDPDARTPKFAVAYLRVLQQGWQLLETGDFSPQVTQDKDFMMEVKYNFSDKLLPELSKKFAHYQVKIAETYFKYGDQFKPDVPLIEDMIMEAYAKSNSN